MDENKKRILQMLAEGKISVDEASRLLYLIGENGEAGGESKGKEKSGKASAKYLYVRVDPKEGHHAHPGRVNVRVPVGLIRAGMKLTALMPPQVADDVNKAMREKGVGFDVRNLKDEDIAQLIEALSDTEINVDSEEAVVHVYAE